MQTSTAALLVAGVLALVLVVVSAGKDEHDAKVTFDGVAEVPAQFMAELQKRGGDKWNKGFNDYHHLRFGRSDPALVATDDLPPFYRYPPFAASSYAEKRASFGNDYGHMRFGRRVPSFTDYGHLRFG